MKKKNFHSVMCCWMGCVYSWNNTRLDFFLCRCSQHNRMQFHTIIIAFYDINWERERETKVSMCFMLHKYINLYILCLRSRRFKSISVMVTVIKYECFTISVWFNLKILKINAINLNYFRIWILNLIRNDWIVICVS